MNKILIALTFLIFIFGCNTAEQKSTTVAMPEYPSTPFLIVLGIAQDAGYPQANCKKTCCVDVWNDATERKLVSCIGLVDPTTNQTWLLDATPDFKDQLQRLQNCNTSNPYPLSGVFLTHAHMGHYTGLMHLGREAMGATSIPVYTMPRMHKYLSENGPWSQLVGVNNIDLKMMGKDSSIVLNRNLQITPLQVPHRDEFSETVGFRIKGVNKSALFIPDIDKWNLWEQDINKEIEAVDYAFLDGTFYQNGEIWGRDMSQIPHPFIVESMARFEKLSTIDCGKVHFIHMNHTNPLLKTDSEAQKMVRKNGFQIATEGQVFEL